MESRTATMAIDARQQFQVLLERHRGIVAKVAHTYAWNAADRADLAQEIAVQLWRAFAKYDPARKFSTWMYRIALNVAISHVRSDRRRQLQTVPLDETLHDVADHSVANPVADQQVRALNRFIHAQSPLDRALLLLYLEERSYRDIAEILGISETNVATKTSRLKQRIRNEI
ncbi:RNA polymerase sigma factor [Pseudoxanthomonas wuyuanensis]|uniref:RNA polymerase sigma-70 factor, ECF subfamily n=1 Tax=Pseudoxanthomonas wuyuanensis TaxID=1073196 RepID=A0A286DDT9_9GAMM|nr:sigma-70 family RNA polymerase sigma factor [Pseudoxanthomonas wuyuanensis]KAF1719989.1 sigma-70 family RNA polymerase sigma factor [Pseudoxanthomonas wuyuanensis]SOD56828.1 RNA polymerase sigma-70 factor, ECF subfamily [Pseudoxanthomonas wuyuanensis]